MIEMFLEGQPVDINEGFSSLLTFAIDDVKNFAARNTTFSKTIILPGTARNNYLFGSIFDTTANGLYNPAQGNYGYNFNAAVGAQCYIFSDNIQVFKGVLRLLEVVVDNGTVEYEVAVFGELGGLINAIGTKKIEDIDLSAYDHAYSIANITASWNTASAGAGYYYPLIDYGTYSTNKKDWDYHTLRPAIYVKELLDKIITGAGYTYTASLFNTTRFKSLIVPNNQKVLQMLTNVVLQAARTSSANVIDSGTAGTIALPWSSVTTALFTASAGNSKFTYTGASTIDLTLVWDIFGEYRTPNVSFTLEIRKNGTLVTGTQYTVPQSGTSTTLFYRWNNSKIISLDPSDYIEFFYVASGTISGTDYIKATVGSTSFESDKAVSTPVNLGTTIKINDTLPKNFLQKDFLASIIKLFNLYIYEDKESNKTLNIAPFVDFFTGDAVDWSHKIDRSSPVRIKPMSELNSRYYEFNFKDDSDYYNEQYKKRYNKTYGSYRYDSEFEFSNDKSATDVIFSGTPLVGYIGEAKVYSTIFKKNGTTEENVDSNIRILQAKKISGVPSWDIKDGATVLSSQTAYGYAGHLDDPDAPANDINFGVPNELFFTLTSGSINVNQFNVYWSAYMAEITHKDSKLLTAKFKLDFMDIYQLDFSKYVWLDGSLFRINKIEDFNATEKDLCTVQLLKVIEKEY